MHYLQIKDHFHQVDPTLSTLFDQMPERLLVSNSDPSSYFGRLCQDIVAQQLGMKAATAITERFLDLFPDQSPTPRLVLERPELAYREIGTSWAKARYLRSLATAVEAEALDFSLFPQMSDEEIIAELVKVKGIGRWTAEMFLIFTLGKPDIFSRGDLGLKNALIKNYGVEILESANLEEKLEKWQPFRSYASLALWHSLDNR